MAKHLEKELEKLKKRILTLSAQVEDRVRLTEKAIESKEIFDAERIIKLDFEIDEEEVEIEEECLKLLALYQPVASDLRFLVATIKINNELERIGDEVVNIARRLKILVQGRNGCAIAYDYHPMTQKVRAMLKMSLDALVNLDVDLAFKVLLMDEEVDQIYRDTYARATEDMKNCSQSIEYLLNLFLISRHLERIGDHTTNIAEEVIYMIEGDIVRHGKMIK